MIRRYGIDTSVLVRLLTGVPEADFARSVQGLSALVRDEGAAVVASNQVIGEAYVAVRHHYGVTRVDARSGLRHVLRDLAVKHPLPSFAGYARSRRGAAVGTVPPAADPRTGVPHPRH